MTLKLALLIAALLFALILVFIDFEWVTVDGNTHLPGWLGLSLACYFGSLLAPK